MGFTVTKLPCRDCFFCRLKLIFKGQLDTGSASLAAFDPNGVIFAVANDTHSKVFLYDLRAFDKEPFSSFTIEDDSFLKKFSYPPRMPEWSGIEFSNDGKYILLGTRGEAHYSINSFSGEITHRFTGLTPNTFEGRMSGDVTFSPDARHVIAGIRSRVYLLRLLTQKQGSGDRQLLVYDINHQDREKNRSPAHVLSCPSSNPPHNVKFNPRYAQIATASKQLVRILAVSLLTWKDVLVTAVKLIYVNNCFWSPADTP